MGTSISYDSMIKEMIRGRDWDKFTAEKTADNINTTPDFLLKHYGGLALEVALDDERKMAKLLELLPEVFGLLQQDKIHLLLTSILTQDSLYLKTSIKNKVIQSMSWAIELVYHTIEDDKHLQELFVSSLNRASDEIKDEGYQQITMHLIDGTITKVDAFTVNDMESGYIRVDIIKDGNITQAT